VEAELAGLATSGATTLVGLMVSDAWERARDRLSAFFARGGDGRAVDAQREQLEASRAELVAARESGADGDETTADLADEWRARLRRVLRADPAAADELRALLAELAPQEAAGPTTVIHNTISGNAVVRGPAIQGQNFNGVHFGGGPPGRR
jgi:hypothetical protein